MRQQAVSCTAWTLFIRSNRENKASVWRVARGVKNQAEVTFRRAKIRRELSVADAPVATQDRRDFFVSHAGEDRAECAQPLAEELQRRGRSVWFSGYELTAGDSLLQKINSGLANSRYGIVVLSPHFFQKPWPKMELDGLAARSVVEGRKVILPVWHNISHAEVARYAPILADRLGITSSNGIGAVADEMLRAFEAGERAQNWNEARTCGTETFGTSGTLGTYGTGSDMIPECQLPRMRVEIRLVLQVADVMTMDVVP